MVDEDVLLERLSVHTDAVIVPNFALFKYFQLPKKLEGNLLLIMYMLDGTLEQIFEKMKELPKPPEPKVV